MIITLMGADFSQKNIGTLNSFNIITALGLGATYNGPTKVEKNAPFSATVTVSDSYKINEANVTVLMGGVKVTEGVTINTNMVSINITKVTGLIVIKVSTSDGTTDEEDTSIITGTLPLCNNMLSVVNGENYVMTSVNSTRLCSGSLTTANGILVPANATVTLTGTSGLRMDYIYATNAGPNSKDISTNVIGGVGTASNFNSSGYFPLNIKGSSNTISFHNIYNADYYFFFVFAAPNKTTAILASDYSITYTIKKNDPNMILVNAVQGGINITNDERTYGTVFYDTTRLHTEPAIYIEAGKTITISGISGLCLDCAWYSSSTMSNDTIVGSASNQISSNYFTLTNGSVDSLTYTNNTNAGYWYSFVAKNTTNTGINASDYTITVTEV